MEYMVREDLVEREVDFPLYKETERRVEEEKPTVDGGGLTLDTRGLEKETKRERSIRGG